MFTRQSGQAACGLAFLFAASAVSAGSFAVNPVRATLSAKQPVGSLVVQNQSSEPTVVQLETVSWAQQDGKDVYVPTKEILATPPIFTIPAGGSQIVRVGMRRAAEPGRELTYRLFLQEVPQTKTDAQGLRVVLRVGIPVFVLPPTTSTPSLRWQAMRTGDGSLRVRVTNSGNAHIQLARSKLMTGGNPRALVEQDVPTYVLAGQTREWLYKVNPLPASGVPLRVAAQTDLGDMSTELVVE
jgi:fimbrial chaperone protein